MSIPNLKRVKVTSEGELAIWLAKNNGQKQKVLLVTHAVSTSDKHVSKEEILAALEVQGWESGFRYTLNRDLVGHVISHP